MIRNLILGMLVLASACSWAQPSDRAVYPISASQVAQALSLTGIHVSGNQVVLGVEDWAASASPVLDLLDTEPGSRKNRIWVRMGCHERQQCRPFYASVFWSGPIPSSAMSKPAHGRTRPVAVGPPVIRFGDHATLVVDDPRLHLEIAVIALQNGAVGQVIHLATPDRKQFYRGEVVSNSMLKGSL